MRLGLTRSITFFVFLNLLSSCSQTPHQKRKLSSEIISEEKKNWYLPHVGIIDFQIKNNKFYFVTKYGKIFKSNDLKSPSSKIIWENGREIKNSYFRKDRIYLIESNHDQRPHYWKSGRKSFLRAVDKNNGKLLWQLRTKGRLSNPIFLENEIIIANNMVEYLGGKAQFLNEIIGIDRDTGKQEWKIEVDEGSDLVLRRVWNNVLYFNNYDGPDRSHYKMFYVNLNDQTVGAFKNKLGRVDTELVPYKRQFLAGFFYGPLKRINPVDWSLLRDYPYEYINLPTLHKRSLIFEGREKEKMRFNIKLNRLENVESDGKYLVKYDLDLEKEVWKTKLSDDIISAENIKVHDKKIFLIKGSHLYVYSLIDGKLLLEFAMDRPDDHIKKIEVKDSYVYLLTSSLAKNKGRIKRVSHIKQPVPWWKFWNWLSGE